MWHAAWMWYIQGNVPSQIFFPLHTSALRVCKKKNRIWLFHKEVSLAAVKIGVQHCISHLTAWEKNAYQNSIQNTVSLRKHCYIWEGLGLNLGCNIGCSG